MPLLDYLKLDFQPKPNPKAIVQVGPVRFTVLTSKLIRMEFDPNETFEDRPSQVFWYRNLPLPPFQKSIRDQEIIIETDHLTLTYQIQESGFNYRFLKIKIKQSGLQWEYGQSNNTNLLGTVRTLDRVDGPTPLNLGLLSRSGWAVVDDSSTLVFNQDGWLEIRESHPQTKDLYFFGYGQDYDECLIDFQKLSGKIPVLPRFVLGNWWSRYWEYHQDELIDLMKEFKKRNIPLSVCIVDMDWHIVETGNESSGWTGYTWNPDLFPDPQDFLDKISDLGLKTALNLHPASGIYPHESQYEAMAKSMGIDSISKQPVPFDIADPKFTKAYFEILHHPLEVMGVDFWWIDWQQGTLTSLEGLDPLFWLNHLHFYDQAKDGHTRPLIFSRWAGLGSHRYPIGFSGDTFVSWKTLQFQPYFTATAANIGYGWWSHDIGGHMGGIEEAELYLRWIQYGVFSPILRLHSTKSAYHERRPWGYDAETEIHASNALRLRHKLIPYLYTAAWINHQEGILPIRPMYHLCPHNPDAYQCSNQYTFGSELIAAPFTTPMDEHTQLSRQVIWLPEGSWFDFFSGEHHDGGDWYAVYGKLDNIPVFAKAGAIIPLGQEKVWGGIEPPKKLIINIYPGADNTFNLYEDDGETLAYEHGAFTLTTFKLTWKKTQLQFEIQPAAGDTTSIPENRAYKLIFFSIRSPETVTLKIDDQIMENHWVYDQIKHQLVVDEVALPPESKLTILIKGSEPLTFSGDSRKVKLLDFIRAFKMNTFIKQALSERLETFIEDPTMLVNYADQMEESHILALIEIWQGKQTSIALDPKEAFQEIINKLYRP